mgnify:CR=1 FL=1
MWALLNSDEDTIVEIIINPKPMTIGGIQHPKEIFTLLMRAYVSVCLIL